MTSVTHITNQSQFVQSNAVFYGTNASGTIASNGISVSVNPGGAGGGIAAAAGSQTQTNGTLLFNNSNGITFGMSNSSVITASHNGLTTAMASNRGSDFVQATAAFAGTNATGTIASNGISVSVNPQTAFVFSNSNGVTFGTNGSTVTASVATNYQSQGAYLTTARASNDAVGLNTAFTAGPLAWTVNSSGISLNAGSAAGTTSGFGGNLISGSMTHNTAGLNLSLNHPAWLTTAMQSNAATISNIRVSAGTTSNLLSAITFSNSNGVSFGLNGSVMTGSHNGLTTARASNDAVGLNTAGTNVTWTVNSSGISFNGSGYVGTATAFSGTNVSATMTHNSAGFSLQLSAPAAGGGGGIAMANSQTTYTSGTAHLSAAGAMTIQSTTGQSFQFSVPQTSSLVAAGALTISTDGNTITISGATAAPAPIVFSAGTTSGSISSVVFSNSNGVSFGLNGSTITASVNAGGAGTHTRYVPYGPFSTASQTLIAMGATSASARFFPIFLSDNVGFNALRVMHSNSYATSSVSGQQTLSYRYALYSANAGTLSSISSGSFSYAVTNSSISATVSYPNSTNVSGYTYTSLGLSSTANIQSTFGTVGGRILDLVFGDTMSLSAGQYWLGILQRHSSSSANVGMSLALVGNANALWNNFGPIGIFSNAQTTNTNYRIPNHGLGAYTVSQSSLPNGVPLTQIAQTQTIMPLISFISS